MITKGERTELRSIVRQQFKVLRAEVMQRQAELLADVDQQIAGRFSNEDQAWGVASHKVQEIVLEANRMMNDVYRELLGEAHVEQSYVRGILPRKPEQQRTDLRHQAASKIGADVKGAMLRLDREEADLLRTLAVGALESEEAHGFLTAIPTVASLVPVARIAELEAQFRDGAS